MQLKKALYVALGVSLILLISWEFFWRSKGFYAGIDDNEPLWAIQRARVDQAEADDVVLIGSSRVLFDIQLDVWEKSTGKRPIQLAVVGSSPLPIFHDLVHHSTFKGTIIVGVTPGLFFSTVDAKSRPWERPQKNLEYYKNFTYAQKLNHYLSLPLQQNLAFLSEAEGVDGIRLSELLKKIKVGNRVPNPMPPFHDFSDSGKDRNTRMKKQAELDTAYAKSIKDVWMFFSKGGGPPPDKEKTIAFFLDDLRIFQKRGGRVILLRCPSAGGVLDHENEVTPRATFWDALVTQSGLKAYHFEDHASLQHLSIPEWSHLSGAAADTFTHALVQLILADGALKHTKNQ